MLLAPFVEFSITPHIDGRSRVLIREIVVERVFIKRMQFARTVLRVECFSHSGQHRGTSIVPRGQDIAVVGIRFDAEVQYSFDGISVHARPDRAAAMYQFPLTFGMRQQTGNHCIATLEHQNGIGKACGMFDLASSDRLRPMPSDLLNESRCLFLACRLSGLPVPCFALAPCRDPGDRCLIQWFTFRFLLGHRHSFPDVGRAFYWLPDGAISAAGVTPSVSASR